MQNGGVVIADCVPQQDAFGQPLSTMSQLFGVSRALYPGTGFCRRGNGTLSRCCHRNGRMVHEDPPPVPVKTFAKAAGEARILPTI